MTTDSAARLVSLYPRRWRDRYGDEFTHVLREQPLTARLALDVIGGALDAWLRRAASHQGEDQMTTRLMKRCATGGSPLSLAEAWRSAWLVIGAALVLAGIQLTAVTFAGRNDYTQALSTMIFPALMFVMTAAVSMNNTSLRTRIVFAAGGWAFLAGAAVLSVWI